jgi:hypothetical protein
MTEIPTITTGTPTEADVLNTEPPWLRDAFAPPHELVGETAHWAPLAGWKAVADGLLTKQSCAFHRNVPISSSYAWI